MEQVINWKDQYFSSKNRTVLTQEQLHIPGIRTMGRHNMQNAVPPLLPHYHENCFEITFVTKGTLSFYVNNSEYEINGGEAFIATPNEIHSTNEVPMSIGEIYWIQFDISDPSHFLYLNKNAASAIIKELHNIKSHTISTDNKEVRKILMQAFLLTSNSDNKHLIASYLTIFLHLLISFTQKCKHPLSPDIKMSLDYIHTHTTDIISLDFLANYCHLSTSQFKQKFKLELGTSPRNYINQQKMEYAKSMLKNQASITQVAIDLGFSTSSYFTVVFKKYTSYTPTEYIKRIQKKTQINKS